MTPDTLPDGFSASAWVQREAGEGETQGENFIFSDLGHYDITLHKARRRAGANRGPFGGSTRTITDSSGSAVERLPVDGLFSKALDGATSRKHRRADPNG